MKRGNAPPHVLHNCMLTSDLIQLLTKFDRKINVASRVLTRKNALPPGSHVFQPTGIIFCTLNVASRVKNAPPLGSHFFQAYILIIFELIQDIIETNLLTKFNEDWAINVASRVLTRKNAPPLFHDDRKIHVTSRVLTRKIAPPPWWPYIIGMYLLTEFYEYRTINVASRENAPPLGGHVFQANVTIFELVQDIIWTINVASRVLTMKNAPSPGGHVFQPTGIIFELVQDIIGINLLTKFHEDWTINVASRVKNAPPLGSQDFQAKVTIFELIQDISETNLLTKFHEYRQINEKCPSPGGHVFQPTGIIFELVQDIIGMNLLTKCYEDQTINVATRVLTRFYYSHIRKNAPPLGSHVLQSNSTIFELIQDIIETNLLTKFHEDWTINVVSRELTRQMLTPHNAQRTTDKKQSQKLAMSTLCSDDVLR
ncbi:hypothetical protein DPMN_007282 [Dreissena polymorpha]|uniref:Uncharacterized protein n=1 Tax=Dreissena polymorpha TaxID=45954 RepID=A0A9D4MVX7_DREPO|nr:hypothetical protein DPMN_007282 [Dreissena polymorpha]